MGVLECASGASVWRGYDYYKQKKIINIRKSEDGKIFATVSGSATTPYEVELDIEHPRKSKCNCPHADGKRIILTGNKENA